MDGAARPRALTPPIWLVGAVAVASGLVGSLLAVLVQAALYPSVVGNMGFPPPRGFSSEFVAALFGLPFSSFVGAVGAYGIVLARRRAVFALVAVLAGAIAGAVVGWGTAGLGNWWATTAQNSGFGWGEITLPLVASAIGAVLLSGRAPLEMVPTTRRGRLAVLISGGALVGALSGMLFGGLVGFFSEFQSPCPPAFYSVSPGECVGLGSGLEAGLLLGMWLGASVGALCGLIVWAAPPPRSGPDESTPMAHSTVR